MAILNLPKGNIYFEIHGCNEKETIVLVSGLTADHNSWATIVPILSANYQVIVFDNFAVGQSSAPNDLSNPLSMKDFSDSAIALCDELKISSAYFVGNSMGGAIVQLVAKDYPNRVKKAVISNSFSYAHDLAFQTYAKARVAGLADGVLPEFISRIELSLCFSGKFLTDERINLLLQLIADNPFPQTSEGYKLQFNALSTFDSRDWLKELKVPCLFIASDQDAITFSSQIKEMAEKVTNSEYLLIKGPGHLPHIEQPEFFVDNLVKYLRQS